MFQPISVTSRNELYESLKSANDKKKAIVVFQNDYDETKKFCEENGFTDITLLRVEGGSFARGVVTVSQRAELRPVEQKTVLIGLKNTTQEQTSKKQLRQIQKSQFRSQQKNMRFK